MPSKSYRYVVVFIFGLVAFLNATQIPVKSLEQRLQRASHVVIGLVTGLDVLDEAGVVVETPNSDAQKLRCRITFETKETLKSDTNQVPKSVTFSYQNKFHKTVRSERDKFINRRMIFLLVGPNFGPVDDWQFAEYPEQEAEVRKLLKSQK